MTLEELRKRDPEFVKAVLRAAEREGAIRPDFQAECQARLNAAALLFQEEKFQEAIDEIDIALSIVQVICVSTEAADWDWTVWQHPLGAWAYACKWYVGKHVGKHVLYPLEGHILYGDASAGSLVRSVKDFEAQFPSEAS